MRDQSVSLDACLQTVMSNHTQRLAFMRDSFSCSFCEMMVVWWPLQVTASPGTRLSKTHFITFALSHKSSGASIMSHELLRTSRDVTAILTTHIQTPFSETRKSIKRTSVTVTYSEMVGETSKQIYCELFFCTVFFQTLLFTYQLPTVHATYWLYLFR